MKNKLRHKIISTVSGRLILWYLISIGLIFLSFSVAISSLFWVTVQNQIDHHVHIAVNEARQIVQTYRGQERDGLIRNLVSAQGMTVVVLSPDGAAVLETNSPDAALATEHQLQKILSFSSLYESAPVHFTEGNTRFAAMPVQVNAGKGIVAVGYSTQVLYAAFYKIIQIVAGVIIFLILPISYFGYKLIKKQLYPLENIALQAKSITDTNSLSKRINISSSTEELKTIQKALNTMLVKLEGIFINERDFFSNAAHTLKTPLAVLRSQIENVKLAQASRDDLIRTLDNANEAIADLLFLSRISDKHYKSEAVSLTDLMTDLAELGTTLGEQNNLHIFSDIQPDVMLWGNKNLLKRALGNIVFNAVVYNRPAGHVYLSLKKHNNNIAIAVKDTGIGITEQDLPQLFKRFFRGSNSSVKGSGLGLAISKAVVESLGGKITITSSVSKGTAVLITFP